MLEYIIRFSLARRGLVMSLVFLVMCLGIWKFNQLPIDAVPDITNVQVVINTEAPGYTPLETEQRVSLPNRNRYGRSAEFILHTFTCHVIACLRLPWYSKKAPISILRVS